MAVEDMDNYRFDKRAPEEQLKIATQGGYASGEARRKKRDMKKILELCLDMKDESGMTYDQLITIGLIKGAMFGNYNNYKTIIEMLGQNTTAQVETPKIELEIINNEELEKELYK